MREEAEGKREKTRNICTKDPSTLLHGTCELITEREEARGGVGGWGGVRAEDLFLTRVQRTVCGMEERHCRSRHGSSVILTFLSSSSSPLMSAWLPDLLFQQIL